MLLPEMQLIPGHNFMALLTVSKESTLTSSIFHRLTENFGLFACILPVTRHSTLAQLAQKFGACK